MELQYTRRAAKRKAAWQLKKQDIPAHGFSVQCFSMPRQRRKTKQRTRSSTRLKLKSHTRSAIWGTLQICAGVLLFLALRDKAGIAGDAVNTSLTFFFGKWGMIFPVFLVISGLLHWFAPNTRIETKRSIGLALCLFSFLGLMHVGAPLEEIGVRRNELAGAIGFLVSVPFVLFLSATVGYVVLATTFLVEIGRASC